MTQLVVITLGYSIISPVINGLAFAAFFLFYMLYKYLFTWVNDQPPSSETGGLFFPKAIQHLFVGLYVQQLCLCALFFLAQDDRHSPSAIPEGALMVVLIIFTVSIIDACILSTPAHVLGQVFFQNTILNSYGPLIKSLPLTLADRSYNGNAGVEPEGPQPVPSSSDDIKVTDFGNPSASSPDQPIEGASSRSDGADDRATDRPQTPSFTDESRAISPLPTSRPMESKGPTDFSHPAAVEEQRMIWLPKDPFGLIHDIEQDLTSQKVLYSTEGAEMDSKGQVGVSNAPPEDVRHASMEVRPSPSPDEGEGDEIQELAKGHSSVEGEV